MCKIKFDHIHPPIPPLCPLVGLFPLYSTWVFLKISFTAWVRKVCYRQAWLISLNTMTSKPIHFPTNSMTLLFVMIEWYSLGYNCCISFIRSPADWHLYWLCNLASVNNASVDMNVQALLLSVTLIRHLPKSVHQNAAESHGSSTLSLLRHLLFSLFSVS